MRLQVLIVLCLSCVLSAEDVPHEAYINIYQSVLNEAGEPHGEPVIIFSGHLGDKLTYWKKKGEPLKYALTGSAPDIKLRILRLSNMIVEDAYKPAGKYYSISFGFSNESGSISGGFYYGADAALPVQITDIMTAIKTIAGDVP